MEDLFDWMFSPYVADILDRKPEILFLFPVAYGPCTTIIAAMIWLFGMLLIRDTKDVDNRKEYGAIFSVTMILMLAMPAVPVLLASCFGLYWLYCHLLGIDLD